MRRVAPVALVVLSLTLAGCSGGGRTCSNDPDTYRCSFAGNDEITKTDTWQNTGEKANVTVRMGGFGTLTVTLTDDTGTTVFNETFDFEGGGSKDRTSEAGQPGAWTIRLDGQFKGGADVRVVKA